jgi:hypothetical protein
VETIRWHFYFEPHPIGYYLAMWAWTKAFGASLLSTRIPEMILGALSIPLVYRVGAMAYDRRVGLAAAAMLSIHGFHIFWSQMARMYAPGCFLGLVSTWLLLEIARRKRPSLALEAGYVAATLGGVLTVELFWPFLFGQILWGALRRRDDPQHIPRMAVVQTLAFILGAPLLSQAAMTGVSGFAMPPTLEFVGQYLAYGFAYFRPPYTFNDLHPAVWALLVLSGLAFTVRGLTAPAADQGPSDDTPSAPLPPVVLCAIGAAVIMFGVGIIAYVRNAALMGMSVIPLAALLIPFGAAWFRPVLARILPAVERGLGRAGGPSGLIAVQALVPPLVVFLISYKIDLTVERAFLIFVPYLLILIAAGVMAFSRGRIAALGLASALAAIFYGSVVVAAGALNTPRDYRTLAQSMQAQMQPGDLMFVRPRNWTTTPIFVYLNRNQLVAGDYAQALQRSPTSRIWVLSFGQEAPATAQMLAPLSGHRRIGQAKSVSQEVATADLYAPQP